MNDIEIPPARRSSPWEPVAIVVAAALVAAFLAAVLP
jgi:hypothetical protein